MRLAALLCLLLAAPTVYELPKKGAVVRLTVAPLGPAGGAAYSVEVQPDGTVRENGKALQARMAPAELQALARYIIETKEIGKHDPAAVARETKDFGVCGTGATTTKIELFVKGHRKTVDVAFMDVFARLQSVRNVAAIAARLRLEGSLARHGGRKRVSAFLAIANKHPAMKAHKPLTLADFQMVNGDGAHFRRDTFAPPTVLTAVVKDGKAKITFLQ